MKTLPTVNVEVLWCPSHKFYAIAIDDLRITPSKCCGTWHTLYTTKVSKQEIKDSIGKR